MRICGAILLLALVCATPGEEPRPVYRLRAENGKQRFITEGTHDFAKTEKEGIAFWAIVTNQYVAGCVPVFEVVRGDRVELRRLPPKGQENFTEPLFFGLPLPEEVQALKISGPWLCEAIRKDGSKDFPDFELAVQGERIAGRFRQTSEYRFAYLTGGTWGGEGVRMTVNYIDQEFVLEGKWKQGQWFGTYREGTGMDEGTWKAWRDPEAPVMAVSGLKWRATPLYEWKRAADNGRRYGVEGTTFGEGWVKEGEPLCLVWLKKD